MVLMQRHSMSLNFIACYSIDTFSVESQLQSKRLRWLGHVFRMSNDRLPKKLLSGQVNVCQVAPGQVSVM